MKIKHTRKAINAATLNYDTPDLKKLRKAIQNIVVDDDSQFIELVDNMINNVSMNYVPETKALKRCINNMLNYDDEATVREWVLKYAADLGIIDSDKSVMSSTNVRRNRPRYVKAAEGDYIKIGNMVLPKNAAGYGYDSYDNIQKDTRRRYDEEKKKEAEAKAAAEAKAKGDALYQEVMQAVKDNGETLQTLFDVLVPASGMADSAAGEFVRAMTRLMYRDYNDGDRFYSGYGLETCGSPAAYLIDKLPNNTGVPERLMSLAESEETDSEYTSGLEQASNMLVEYLLNSPELFGQKPDSDSIKYNSSTLDELSEMSHNLEYEVDTSGDLYELIEEYNAISWRDFRDFLEELCRYYGGSVNSWARDAFSITDLDSEQYQEWEDHFFDELESYVEDIRSEMDEDEEEEDWE